MSVNIEKEISEMYNRNINMIVVGDSGVGKTLFIHRFLKKQITPESSNDTIHKWEFEKLYGYDPPFHFTVSIYEVSEKTISAFEKIKLKESVVDGCNCMFFIIMFNLSDPIEKSLQSITKWISLLRKSPFKWNNTSLFLIGTHKSSITSLTFQEKCSNLFLQVPNIFFKAMLLDNHPNAITVNFPGLQQNIEMWIFSQRNSDIF